VISARNTDARDSYATDEVSALEGAQIFATNAAAVFDDLCAHARKLYDMTMEQPPFLPGFVKDAFAQEQAERRDQLAEIFEDFSGKDLLDEHLAEIAAPTLILWGEVDRLVDPSAAQVWLQGLPNATLTTYSGVGHMPMLEVHEQSAEDYREFLAGLN
jgi:abhydrolase domain-containing protein 6